MLTEDIHSEPLEFFELPEVPNKEGFSYLYELLSHVTSSRLLFSHKLFVLLNLSRDISKSSFTRGEMEAMFPQYPKKVFDSILNSLLSSNWFKREEGSLYYSLSKPGLLFIRFLPFLYKGNEMDEMAFQFALNQIFQVAETMDLDIEPIEFLRDQAINGLRRTTEEIKASLISKNPERILETSKKMSVFLKVIDEFLHRLKELNKKKSERKIPFNEADRNSISILQATKMEIIHLNNVRHEYLRNESIVGDSAFTIQDVERFLYKADFHSLSQLIDSAGFVPSNAKWVDENDIVRALNVFLLLKKNIKNRKISQKVKGYRDNKSGEVEEPFLNKVVASLNQMLSQTGEVSLHTFLFTQNSKVDGLMYLASLCFLEGKQMIEATPFTLDISLEAENYHDELFTTLSKGVIKRRNKDE